MMLTNTKKNLSNGGFDSQVTHILHKSVFIEYTLKKKTSGPKIYIVLI